MALASTSPEPVSAETCPSSVRSSMSPLPVSNVTVPASPSPVTRPTWLRNVP